MMGRPSCGVMLPAAFESASARLVSGFSPLLFPSVSPSHPLRQRVGWQSSLPGACRFVAQLEPFGPGGLQRHRSIARRAPIEPFALFGAGRAGQRRVGDAMLQRSARVSPACVLGHTLGQACSGAALVLSRSHHLTMRSSGPRGHSIVFPASLSARGRLTRRWVAEIARASS
jgi:hypothetical protein